MLEVKTIGMDEIRWELMDTVLHHSNNPVAAGIAWGFTSVTPYGARVASVEVFPETGDDDARRSSAPVRTERSLPPIRPHWHRQRDTSERFAAHPRRTLAFMLRYCTVLPAVMKP